MRLDIHVHIAPNAEVAQFMKTVLGALSTLKEGQRHMSEAQDRFTRELGEMKDAVNAAAAKIGELAEIIRNNPGNDDILNDAADQLDAMEAQLAAAGSPVPEPTPEPEPDNDVDA